MSAAVLSRLWDVTQVISRSGAVSPTAPRIFFCQENYDYDEQKIINNIIANRKRGKKHHIIVNAEGVGSSTSMARRIEAATGIEDARDAFWAICSEAEAPPVRIAFMRR